MEKIKQADLLKNIRTEALEMLDLPSEKFQIAPSTYLVKTASGFAKVAVTAVKPAEDFDPAQLEADYLFEVEDKARIKAEKEAIKAKEKAAKIALKEAKSKDKAWPCTRACG